MSTIDGAPEPAAPDSPTNPTPAATWDRLDALLFAACWLPYAFLVRRFWYLTDDAFISFRYAKNFAAGHGLRYNLGPHEPVEGYSNFLWVILCSGFEYLALDIEFWPLAVSAACGSALLWLVHRTARLRLGFSTPIAALSTLLVGLHAPFAVYSTSGLAVMPFTLFLFIGFERLVLRRAGPAAVVGALALLGAALTRVEGIYWALVILVLAALGRLIARERCLVPLAKAGALLALTYGAYWFWRYDYYGLPFANTVYAKSGMSMQRLGRGFDYVMVQWLTHVIPFLTIPAAFSILRRRRLASGLPIAALAFGFPAYAIVVTGDFMAMSRFLVPGWIYGAFLLGFALEDVARVGSRSRTLAVTLGLAMVVVGSLSGFNKHLVPRTVRQKFHFRLNGSVEQFRSEYEQWAIMAWNGKRWAAWGRGLKKWAPPGGSLALGGIGGVGYYSELFIHDTNGLVTRDVATRNYVDEQMRSPGHDRRIDVGAFVSRYLPSVIKVEVMDGLPGLDETGDEQRARDRFLALFQARWLDPLSKAADLRELYVADFRPLADWEDDSAQLFSRGHVPRPNQFLVFWRRMADGAEASSEWAAIRGRLSAYHEKGADRYRRGLRRSYPVPHWARERAPEKP